MPEPSRSLPHRGIFPILPRLAIVAGSGALLSLGYAPISLGWVVWLWMIPLLAVIWTTTGKRRRWKGFGLGWLAGVVFFLINLAWLATVSWIAQLLLSCYLACFFGLWGVFAASLGNPWRQRCEAGIPICHHGRAWMMSFACAAVWCGTEWLRGNLFGGFGWNGLGVAFSGYIHISQAADVVGVVGLSFLPVFVQCVAVQALRRTRADGWRVLSRLDMVSAVILLAVVWGYGAWRIRQVEALPTYPVKALLVQLNIPQDAAKVLVSEEEVHQGYEDETVAAFATLAARNERPDWVLWPESALFGRLMRADDGRWGMWRENDETIRRVRGLAPFTLMFGLTEMEADLQGDQLVMKEDAKSYNSIAVIAPDGDLQSFRKHHLVIFGETIPFLESIPFLKKIYEQQSGAKYEGSYTPGNSFDPLQAEAEGRRIGLIPTVCFEDTLGNLARKFVRGGPQVIINVTNDGWFKEREAADQHFANAKFRAIELRRPLVRCANTGVSGVVTATGSVMRRGNAEPQILTDTKGSHFTRGWKLVVIDVPKEPPFTLYALLGDWMVIGLGWAGLLSGWRMRKQAEACRD